MNLETKEPSEREPMNLERISFAIILATLTFVLGFMISYIVSYNQENSLEGVQENLKYDLLSFQVENELANGSCQLFDPYRFAVEMEKIGFSIDLLEKRLGKEDKQVIEKKKLYSLLEVQHFLYVEKYKKNCNNSMHTVLFFYSNNPNEATDGELLGRLLDYLKLRHNNLMIYSFDYNLDTPIINTLKYKYNITEPNIIIVDDKIKLSDVKKSKEIKRYIQK